MKRTLCTILCLALLFPLFVLPSQAEEPYFPLKDQKTLRIFSSLDTKAALSVVNYSELECFKKIEELTNVKIEWLHPSAASNAEAFSVMIVSGDYPDIIYYGWSYVEGGPEKYIADKVILNLKDPVSKWAPNYSAALEKNAEYKKGAITDAGSLWGFALLFGDYDDPQGYPKSWLGPQIRKDWLDKLGLEPPTSMEEWTKVLTAFKENDMDGDGNPSNEIPFIANKNYANANLSLGGFVTSFGILWDFYYDKDGQVQYGPVQEGARQWLSLMAQWFKDGLIDPDFAGNDGSAVDSKINSLKVGAWMTGSPRWGHYVTANPDKEKFNPIGVQWPADKDGKQHTTNGDVRYPFGGSGAAITTGCKDVELATRWLDFLFSEEGSRIMNWGIEGKSFEMKDGKPAYTDEIVKNPEGKNIEAALSKYTFVPLSGWAVLQDGYAKRGTLAIPGQLELYDLWAVAEGDLVLPPYMATAEESQKLSFILNDIKTFRDEYCMNVITGVESIDNFDSYVETLKSMGLDEALAIVRAAVKRYEDRK